MNQRDQDLIAAYAEGSLDADDATLAASLIAQDPVARAEYEAQQAALAALQSAPPARLTATERTELRTAIASELRLEPSAPVAAGRSSRRPRLAWALGLAAAAIVFVIAGTGLVSTFSISSDSADTTTQDFADAPAATSTVPAAATDRATSGDSAEAEERLATAQENAGDDAGLGFAAVPPAAAESDEDTAQPVEQTTTTSAASDGGGTGTDLPVIVDLGSLTAAEFFELESKLEDDAFARNEFDRQRDTPLVADPAHTACVAMLLDEHEGATVELLAAADIEGTHALIYAITDPFGSVDVVARDSETCDPVPTPVDR